jgi:hypothetical protein
MTIGEILAISNARAASNKRATGADGGMSDDNKEELLQMLREAQGR